MTSFCSISSRVVIPWAAVFMQELQHIQMTSICSMCSCVLVPWAAVFMEELQHVQMTFKCTESLPRSK